MPSHFMRAPASIITVSTKRFISAKNRLGKVPH
jgi:hypothetical protein